MQGVLGLALPPDPLSGPGTFLALLFGGVLAQLFRNYVERQTECCASSVVSRVG